MRAQQRVSDLQQAQKAEQKTKEDTHRVQARQVKAVTSWARGKSLIRMLTTLGEIMPGRCPPLKLRLSSKASDVKRAYKQALRAVHPDKLPGASLTERVRGEAVFNALREAHATATRIEQERSSGGTANRPIWSRRW